MNVQDKFNQKDTILVVSDYPEKSKRGEKNYGIAWYTKETIEPIADRYNRKFIVLAEKDGDNSPKLLCGGKILLLRVFDPKRRSLFPVILKWLWTFDQIDSVYIHSEFCANGGIKNFVLLLPFLLLIKLSGREITYFAHNVVTDLTGIAPHLNLNKKALSFRILNSGIKFYYAFLGILCNQIVVMDEEMKRRLSLFVWESKITSLPFWIKDDETRLTKSEARKKLGIAQNKFVLLYFGFVTWYKGADWLIDQVTDKKFAKKFPKLQLILAGGEAYSLKDKEYYQKYYQEQLAKVRTSKNARITDFVPDKDIALYFSAADAVVFPYRGLIGSSGALAYALTYRKPFLLSFGMKSAMQNEEYLEALKITGLSSRDLTFGLSQKSFINALTRLTDKEKLRKLEEVAELISQKRSFAVLMPKYYQAVFCGTSQKAVNLKRKAAYAYGQVVNR